ncbi:MAG: D-aminoacyl-tRNA deacylase [Magnetococcus sp. WYHC-3]
MKILVQRVLEASVTVGDVLVDAIGRGLLLLVAIEKGDGPMELEYLARKVANLRIFEDEQGRMNYSVADVSGGLLVVPQFTLAANTSKGCRPSYENAAPPEEAEARLEEFVRLLVDAELPVARGRFRADMKVALVNDGPVTIWLDRPPVAS